MSKSYVNFSRWISVYKSYLHCTYIGILEFLRTYKTLQGMSWLILCLHSFYVYIYTKLPGNPLWEKLSCPLSISSKIFYSKVLTLFDWFMQISLFANLMSLPFLRILSSHSSYQCLVIVIVSNNGATRRQVFQMTLFCVVLSLFADVELLFTTLGFA